MNRFKLLRLYLSLLAFGQADALLSAAVEDPSWWRESPTVSSWRYTHLAYNNQEGIGQIFDGFWPYVWMSATQSWTYFFTEGASPESFFAYDYADSGRFLWVSNLWGWYYRYDSGTWHQIPVNRLYSVDSFSLVPGGECLMGNNLTDSGGATNELPAHSVYVSALFVSQYEVSLTHWQTVYNWAITHGYSFTNAGTGKGSDHPVVGINWYDAIKWCNARSEMESLTPVYYTDSNLTTPYRTGETALSSAQVNWSAIGYRLPTEAEWEYAARAGDDLARFGCGDFVDHSKANYDSDTYYSYDQATNDSYNPSWNNGITPYTCPIDTFSGNRFELYNVNGNAGEWCWDYYGSTYYATFPDETTVNPLGPDTGTNRIYKGGSWFESPASIRNSKRNYRSPAVSNDFIGFRVVRKAYAD
jgi:formylglycine-generating enzyme required for sulfatase activity